MPDRIRLKNTTFLRNSSKYALQLFECEDGTIRYFFKYEEEEKHNSP